MRGKLEIIISGLAVLAGVALLFVGLYMEPPGEIDYSLLVAYGETLTFAGAIIGVDYSYRCRGGSPGDAAKLLGSSRRGCAAKGDATQSKGKESSNARRTGTSRKATGENGPRDKGQSTPVD